MMKKIAVLCSLGIFSLGSYAETALSGPVDTGVNKSLKQSLSPPKPVIPSTPKSPYTQGSVAINKLADVKVTGNVDEQRIRSLLAPYIGKSMTARQLDDFKDRVWFLLEKQGYLSYAEFQLDDTTQGTVLIVTVKQAKVGTYQVDVSNDKVAANYEERLKQRFANVLPAGQPLDLWYLENRLNSASYDLPLDLRSGIKQSGPDQVDVTVNAKEKLAELGHPLEGMIQFNDYGLRSYGHPQAVGTLKLGGFTPYSYLGLTALKSQGINFGKTEYTFPSSFLRGRINLWGSAVSAHNIMNKDTDTKEKTYEGGANISHVLATTRHAVFKSNVGFSARHTMTQLKSTSQDLDNITDKKIRVAFTADNEALSGEHFRYELAFTRGDYGKSKNYDYSYFRAELNGSIQKNITDDGLYFTTLRFQGQMSNKNLNSFDRFSLGGVSGVRAFTTQDGVGDQGLSGSIDVFRRLGDNHYVGVFYDGGIINPNKKSVTGTYNSTYSLQAIGVEVGGTLYKNFSYNLALAQGIGSYKGHQVGNVESNPHSGKFLASLSYQF